jgi:class 3 adenylate cyclase
MTSTTDEREAARKGSLRHTEGDLQATLCVVDLKGSTRLKPLLGNRAWRAIFRWFYELVAVQAEVFDGEVVKFDGDGALVAFRNAALAVNWAIRILELTVDACATGEIPDCLAAKVAINYGTVLGIHTGAAQANESTTTDSREWDILGTPVDLAFELCGKAKPMALLVTMEAVHAGGMNQIHSVRGQSATPRRNVSEYLGREQTLKNLKAGQTRYSEILWADRRFGVKGLGTLFFQLLRSHI